MTRATCADWPRLLCPAPGHRPLAATPRPERILHVALRVPGDPQAGLERALRGVAAAYEEVVWTEMAPAALPDLLYAAAARLRPTLVFAQIQTPRILAPTVARTLRTLCDSDAVLVQWDGDRREAPAAAARAWFRELAPALDASLVVCTKDAEEYAAMGLSAGYIQIGVDAEIWRPATPTPGTPPVVLLANFNGLPGYASRIEAVRRLSRRPDFAVYGGGWESAGFSAAHRPHLAQHAEAGVYSACKAALSASIRNDLPRYTSDRLFRALACGAAVLVESFPDCEGLGLEDGRNCLLWDDPDHLDCVVRAVLGPGAESLGGVRRAARELALTHTWEARMHELAAIIAAIRARRQS